MKMIEVVVKGVSFSIYCHEEVFQLKKNDLVIFEDRYYSDVRAKLLEETGF